MDIQDKLKRDYENKSIYTAGFYADPDNDLANRKKLFDVLKSLVENQEATTPFALQIMLTNGEINVMPLGLVDLDELKKYENEQRSKHGLDEHNDDIPLLIQYAPHAEKKEVVKKRIGTVQDLFTNFNEQIEKIWQTIKKFMQDNFTNRGILCLGLVHYAVCMATDSQSIRRTCKKNRRRISRRRTR